MPTKTTATKRAASVSNKPVSNKIGAKSAANDLKKNIATPPSMPTSKKTPAKTNPPQSAAVVQQRTDLDIDHYRTLLIEERQRMEEELEQVRSRTTDMENGLPEEGESGDEDTADLASAMMDKEMDLSVEDELKDVLLQVDRAFQKIEEGTYGICDVSGEPIPKSRLELIPNAILTVACQEMSES